MNRDALRMRPAVACSLSSLVALASLSIAGCGGLGAAASTPADPGGHANLAGPIRHVVVIIQENRSFDNLFNGYPGADTARSGLRHDGSSKYFFWSVSTSPS